MTPPQWDGAEVLHDQTWIPASPESAHSARLLAERWTQLTLVATAPVRDARGRHGHVMIAYDPLVLPPEPRFLAVAVYGDPTQRLFDKSQRLFEMSHHQTFTSDEAREWLSLHHTGDLPLTPSPDAVLAARLTTALRRGLAPSVSPPALPSKPTTTPRALGR